MATFAQVWDFSKPERSSSVESCDTDVSTNLQGDYGCSSQDSPLWSNLGTDSEGTNNTYWSMVCGDSSMDLYLATDETSEEISKPRPEAQASGKHTWMHDLSLSLRARLLGSKGLLKTGNEKEIATPKKFLRVNERDIQNMYKIGSAVMESTHRGVEVLFATRVEDGKEVVIKTRQKHSSLSSSFKNLAEEQAWCRSTECQLNMPKVQTICQLFDVLETCDCYYVVMEKAGGDDLCELMTDGALSELDVLEVMRQILWALVAMHKVGRIHKDLKLENVMVDLDSPTGRARAQLAELISECPMSSAEVKLIDFDTVTSWQPNQPIDKTVVGTDGYIAPEAYDGEYSPASDLYAAGVIMYFVLTGTWPFRREIFDDLPGENYVGSPAMKRIQERLRAEQVDFTRSPLDRCPEASDLVAKLLADDPDLRPSARQALAHDWFAID